MNKKVILILLPVMMVFILSGIVISTTIEHPGHCGATNPADIIFYCGSDAGSIECEYD
tara:strand:+ start:1317 stop:1490 length:174 start_codon:yes stop_codon:yes gene_type:complete